MTIDKFIKYMQFFAKAWEELKDKIGEVDGDKIYRGQRNNLDRILATNDEEVENDLTYAFREGLIASDYQNRCQDFYRFLTAWHRYLGGFEKYCKENKQQYPADSILCHPSFTEIINLVCKEAIIKRYQFRIDIITLGSITINSVSPLSWTFTDGANCGEFGGAKFQYQASTVPSGDIGLKAYVKDYDGNEFVIEDTFPAGETYKTLGGENNAFWDLINLELTSATSGDIGKTLEVKTINLYPSAWI